MSDETMDQDQAVKAWMCPSREHVLGQVVRNGNGVRVLLLYRNAVSKGEGEVDVMAVVEGYVADVRCDICGKVRTWVPGEEALQKLIERAQREADHGQG